MNGFYSIYFTGTTGSGFGLVALKDGTIIGADVTGGTFDGQYEVIGNQIEGKFINKLPPGAMSITGLTAGPDGLTLEYPLRLPLDLGAGHTVAMQTPYGPINVIVKKIRDLI
jgi:hypothetical protein